MDAKKVKYSEKMDSLMKQLNELYAAYDGYEEREIIRDINAFYVFFKNNYDQAQNVSKEAKQLHDAGELSDEEYKVFEKEMFYFLQQAILYYKIFEEYSSRAYAQYYTSKELRKRRLTKIQGVIGVSWLDYKGKDIWLFGERHVPSEGACGDNDALDVKKNIDFNTTFSGSDYSVVTFPRLLYAWFGRIKRQIRLQIPLQDNVSFFLERPMNDAFVAYDDDEGNLNKLRFLFSECFDIEKKHCEWFPIFMQAIDYRTLIVPQNYDCDLEKIEDDVKKIINTRTVNMDIFNTYANLYRDLLFKPKSVMQSYEKIADDFVGFATTNLLLNVNKNGEIDLRKIMHEILTTDEYDYYLLNLYGPISMRILKDLDLHKKIINYYKKNDMCKTYASLIFASVIVSTLFEEYGNRVKNKNLKFLKYLPDGRVVSRQRAQLLGLDKDGVRHRDGRLMSDVIIEWALSKLTTINIPDVSKYIEDRGTSISHTDLHRLRNSMIDDYSDIYRKFMDAGVLMMDVAGIARSLRTFRGKRKHDDVIGYFGDFHRKNWREFYVDVLGSSVKSEAQAENDEMCLVLPEEMRDALLEKISLHRQNDQK
jgi:hypothetical protein